MLDEENDMAYDDPMARFETSRGTMKLQAHCEKKPRGYKADLAGMLKAKPQVLSDLLAGRMPTTWQAFRLQELARIKLADWFTPA